MEPDRLDHIPTFAALTPEERAERAGCLREVTVDAGTSLIKQGDNAYELFFIEDGEAEVRRGGESIATLAAGDVVGEIGMFVTGTRTASVVATSPMRLLALFTRDFKRIEREMPSLVKAVRDTMAERVARTSF
jgi:CRP-like cAMP-binding protein